MIKGIRIYLESPCVQFDLSKSEIKTQTLQFQLINHQLMKNNVTCTMSSLREILVIKYC